MFSTELTPSDQALIKRFHAARLEIGLDGSFDLPPADRAVLEVASMARRMAIIEVLKKIGLKGSDASDFVFSLVTSSHEPEPTTASVDAELMAICKAKS